MSLPLCQEYITPGKFWPFFISKFCNSWQAINSSQSKGAVCSRSNWSRSFDEVEHYYKLFLTTRFSWWGGCPGHDELLAVPNSSRRDWYYQYVANPVQSRSFTILHRHSSDSGEEKLWFTYNNRDWLMVVSINSDSHWFSVSGYEALSYD